MYPVITTDYALFCKTHGLTSLDEKDGAVLMLLITFNVIDAVYKEIGSYRNTVIYLQDDLYTTDTIGWSSIVKLSTVFPIITCRNPQPFSVFLEPMSNGHKLELNNTINELCTNFDSSKFSNRRQEKFCRENHLKMLKASVFRHFVDNI